MCGPLNEFIRSSIQESYVNKDGNPPGGAGKHVAAGCML